LLPQFQAQMPHPLRDDLPEFLPAEHVRTPAIGILLLILICKNGLEGATMQVQVKHISTAKGVLG
jgi:hypothetical protein